MTMPAGNAGPAAGGNAPASGGTPGGAAANGADPAAAAAAVPAWYEGVAPDLAAWAKEQNLDKPEAALIAHRGIVKLKGAPANELLHLKPGWDEKPETAAEVYGRLGRPQTADAYQIPAIPIGDGDVDLAPKFKTWAHEAGLTPKQATALATHYQGELTAFAAARKEAFETKRAQDVDALRSEWGGAYDENVRAGSTARAKLAGVIGLDDAKLDKLEEVFGHIDTMKLFAVLGRTMGEHKAVVGDQGTGDQFGMTPAAAEKKAQQLMNERAKLEGGNMHPRYREISAEITRLFHIGTGEPVAKGIIPPGA